MRLIPRDKTFNNTITRWDRIHKRNGCKNSYSFNSDIKHMLEKEFISPHDESVLCGKMEPNTALNPMVVMDIRHEMFRKIPRKSGVVTVSGQRTLDTCISHNLVVENTFIKNEIKKLRQQFRRSIIRQTLKNKSREDDKQDISNLENNFLMLSLKKTAKYVEDFYKTPLEDISVDISVNETNKNDLQEHQLTSKNDLENLEKNFANRDHPRKKHIKITKHQNCANKISERTILSEGIDLEGNEVEYKIENPLNCKVLNYYQNRNSENPVIDNHYSYQTRSVRFDEFADIKNFNRCNALCSNAPNGTDRIVSDMTEKAIFELQIEAEEKEFQKSQYESEGNKPPTTDFHHNLRCSQKSLNVENASDSCITKNLNDVSQVDSEHITPKDLEEESTGCQEKTLIITQPCQSRINTHHSLLQKYFLKWIHFITIEKIERNDMSSKNGRIHKINLFLDKIRKEKLRLTHSARKCSSAIGRRENQIKSGASTQVSKKYLNKIKIQQNIIDLQRLKLERQERLILELKFNKLSSETKEARQDLKNELKSIIQYGDQKFKEKAKCLQLIGNLREDNNRNVEILQGKSMMPKFLLQMQERALERSIRHEKARQRRLQQDAEKEAQKMAAEEAKRLEDEEAKRLRIETLKEKRRLEKLAKILKEREYQQALEAKCKADEFYRRWLLRRLGMGGFKRLIERKRENSRKCEQFRKKVFKCTYFQKWRDYYQQLCNKKLELAEELFEKILKRNTLQAWKLYMQNQHSKFNVAVDWCDLKRAETIFKPWAEYITRMRAIGAFKMNQAKSHHEWHLKWKVLDCWQRLPQTLQLERETEERRQRWRIKIWELLPDYTPNRADIT